MGWSKPTNGSDLAPCFHRRDVLSVEGGCLQWGGRVIIPPALRAFLLTELHSGHSDVSRMKELARSYL